MPTAVALDGPAGAGKSSIAKRAAKELGFIYVDTGALYRTIGLAASRAGVEPVDSPKVDALLEKITVELTFNDKGEQVVLLNGEDVSGEIRTPEASMTASKISAIPNVRAYLLDLQRDIWTAGTSVQSCSPTLRSRFFSPPLPRQERADVTRSLLRRV